MIRGQVDLQENQIMVCNKLYLRAQSMEKVDKFGEQYLTT
jgi:hypothetical protein